MKKINGYWLLTAWVFFSCDAILPHETNPNDCVAFPTVCDASKGESCDPTTHMCSGTACGDPTDTDLSHEDPAKCTMPAAAHCANHVCIPCDIDTECTQWSNVRGVSPIRNYCLSLNGVGTCVECKPGVSGASCMDPTKPTCDATTGLCRPCMADNDCTSGICRKPGDYPATAPVQGLVTGQCVDPMYIAYVNNNTSSCKDSNPGTQDSPFCNITPAITANKPYINVAGSPKTYGTVALSSGGSFVIVGAGRDAMTTTILDQVNVTNGTLVLSNLQVLPSLASAAVTCNGSTSSIYLASTVVINGTGRGIDAEMNCGQLTVDRTFVNCKSNGFYGIIVGNSSGSMTSYRIVNSAVTQCGNMSGEPYGVLLQHQAQASTGYFAFNTVTGNYNGVSCSIGMPLIQNSIIAGNNEYNNTSVAQVNVCNTDSTVEMNSAHVVFSPTASGVPALATGNATNTMWIVDRGTPPPGNQSVPTDYFGVTRPQGQQYDIGFQELQ